MTHPVEELNHVLGSFLEQNDYFVLLLTTRDEEIPLVVRGIDALDGESPADVFFIDTTPLRSAKQYADDVVRNAWTQLAEVNEERLSKGLPPLAEIPPGCWAAEWTPTQRLAMLIHHMSSWLPPEGDHRLVVALLPSDIEDRDAHAQILGGLVPFNGYEDWMRGIRIVVRDDGAAPFAEAALRKAGVRSVLLYTTQVTVGAIADATAREAENRELPPARRINALLQCATFDVALGRYEAALEKYGTLYTFYDKYQVHEMRALTVQGVGDVMSRMGRLPAARDKYLQALDIASDAKSVTQILNLCAAIGDIDVRMGWHAEAVKSYGIGASAAEKTGNGFARADLLEKCGVAQATSGDLRGAAEAWTAAANVARDFSYDPRLQSVLERLLELSQRAGYHELAAGYARELQEVRQRLSNGTRGQA
ncbi:hypothetical protein LZC95_14430 [Pendulispora brunnea]|uniref:Tetratricopeptide repeat protein n=1 Tax=Pendulispora brunnea TaxID=2905690 RepID=A0ABZ2KHJ2_9BACT